MPPRSPDTTDKAVGTRVRMERLAAGLSQQALAEALGVSFQQIQKYEKGVNRISVGRVAQICQELKIPVQRIIGGTDTKAGVSLDPKLEEIQSFLATSDGMALMKAFRSIPQTKVRRELIALTELISVSLKPQTSGSRAPKSGGGKKSKAGR